MKNKIMYSFLLILSLCSYSQVMGFDLSEDEPLFDFSAGAQEAWSQIRPVFTREYAGQVKDQMIERAHTAKEGAKQYVKESVNGATDFVNQKIDSVSENINQKIIKNPINEAGNLINNKIEIVSNNLNQKFDVISNNLNQKIDVTSNNLNQKIDVTYINLKSKLIKTGVVVSASMGLILASKYFWNYLEKKIYQPKILDKTIGFTYLGKIKNILYKNNTVPLIFDKLLQKKLNDVSFITKKITSKNILGEKGFTYKNLLLYGPSGLGKSAFVENLAITSHMPFARVNCLDFATYKGEDYKDLVKRLNACLLSSSRVLVCLDNADYLFNNDLNTVQRNIITSFLDRLSKANDKIMMVFIANSIASIDKSIVKLVDKIIEFNLPDQNTRFDILKLYRDNNNLQKHITNDLLQELSTKTDTLSGLELKGVIEEISLLNRVKNSIDRDSIEDIINDYIYTKERQR